jgi:arginyl-tRNA--protein-N-Asp/Glu arginylyltransferase
MMENAPMYGYTYTSPPSPCHYLPAETQELRHVEIPALDHFIYGVLLQQGWRRFGDTVFRPECRACTACQSLRVPVEAFRLSESQRRVWRRNQREVELKIGAPTFSSDKEDLLRRFHQFGHDTKGWPGDRAELRFFLDNPFPTEEWTYWLGERLVGVGYVDALAEGLSAIYFFHEPGESRRSLGTFNILTMIEQARQRGLSHVYLGYYVEGCRSLEYKRRFGPNEVLLEDGVWGSLSPR